MLSLPFSYNRFVKQCNPNFEQKRFEYISRTGLDPATGKEADKELLNYATNYTKYAPSIKAGYDFLMVGAAAWSTRAYNKDIQTQRADAQINEYYQIKDVVRNHEVGSVKATIPNLDSNIEVSIDSNGRYVAKSNLGQEIDITPSSIHKEVHRKAALHGEPNSSIDILDSETGEIRTRRFYDVNGDVYRDVGMSNHG